MMRKQFVLSLTIVLVLCLNLVSAQKQLPKDLCISAKEFRLYQLINTYRSINNMPSIDLSASLSHVAQTHVADLNQNHPDTSICNLHSWSDKGDWSACCYQSYVPKQDCMWNKPKELTPYKYRGYELAYYDPEGIVPDSMMIFWLKISEVQDMLLNRGNYKKKKWLAAGIGIQNGYAVVWFGQVKDKLKTPKICDKKKAKTGAKTKVVAKVEIPKNTNKKTIVVNKKTGRFYLIFGSYNRQKEAEKYLKRYFKDGFTDAKIVISSQKVRISLSDHPNLDSAKAAKKKLSTKYKDAWIIKF